MRIFTKRAISLILTFWMLTAAFVFFPAADAEEGYRYTLEDGVLTVSGSGAVGSTSSLESEYPWNDVRSEITGVVVEDGITSVGKCAFTKCPNLLWVRFGSDMAELNMDALAYCPKLTDVTFSCALTYIGQGTVYGSGAIANVTLTDQTREAFLALARKRDYNDNYAGVAFTETGAVSVSDAQQLPLVPAYGEVENYKGNTYFIVSGLSSDAVRWLSRGEYDVKIQITDETMNVRYEIPAYRFEDPDNEIYATGGNPFLRLAVCRYGVVPVYGHSYTLAMQFEKDGVARYFGATEAGAFDSFNDAFIQNGPVVPEETDPCVVVRGDTPDPMDFDNSGRVDISDVTLLLNALAGAPAGNKTFDVDADGQLTITDVTELLNYLASPESVDPFNFVRMNAAQAISDLSGYDGILRVKTTGELLFSPTFTELRSLISGGANYDEFIAYLRFSDDRYTYRTVEVQPRQSRGQFVDFFLMGDGIDCGFCPTAGVSYEIELILVRSAWPEAALYYGTYHAVAPAKYAESEYYDPTPAGTQTVHRAFTILYQAGNGGSISGAAKQTLKEGQLSTEVTAIPDEGYEFVVWSDGVTEPVRSGDSVTKNTTLTALFVKTAQQGNLASVYVYTETGAPILTKEYEPATLVIRGAANEKDNVVLPMTIKGRGNSSWNGSAAQSAYDSKNSYSIKLLEKAKLLSIGDSKSKKWVLNANKFDASGLRNYLVWNFANRMGTIGYVVDNTWVQLYVNDEYRGMYMLTEKIDTGKDRVNVNDDPTGDPDKGYLMELDFRGNQDTDPWFDIEGYGPDPASDRYSAVEFVIKSDIEGQQDIDFIQDYVQRCHNAMMSGDREAIEELVDLPSLIDTYILEELSKDCDAGRASFYICKDTGGKLYFTAPWDFDFGFGTYGPAQTTTGLVSTGSNCCVWFGCLITRAWFRSLVLARMSELDGALEDTLQAVAEKGAFLKEDADRNAAFWNLYGRNYHGYVSYQTSAALADYDAHVEFILNWTTQRWANLKTAVQNAS